MEYSSKPPPLYRSLFQLEACCVGHVAESKFKCLIFCRSLHSLAVAFHGNAARDRERDIKPPASSRWTATCQFCVKPENVPVGSCWCLRDNTYTSISLTPEHTREKAGEELGKYLLLSCSSQRMPQKLEWKQDGEEPNTKWGQICCLIDVISRERQV